MRDRRCSAGYFRICPSKSKVVEKKTQNYRMSEPEENMEAIDTSSSSYKRESGMKQNKPNICAQNSLEIVTIKILLTMEKSIPASSNSNGLIERIKKHLAETKHAQLWALPGEMRGPSLVVDTVTDSGIMGSVVPFGRLVYSLASSLSLAFFMYLSAQN